MRRLWGRKNMGRTMSWKESGTYTIRRRTLHGCCWTTRVILLIDNCFLFWPWPRSGEETKALWAIQRTLILNLSSPFFNSIDISLKFGYTNNSSSAMCRRSSWNRLALQGDFCFCTILWETAQFCADLRIVTRVFIVVFRSTVSHKFKHQVNTKYL